MEVIDKAVSWALQTANDDSHGYSQSVRWGPHYDCSSFVITAYKTAGANVGAATYTGDMYRVFTSNGFNDVTSSISLSSGAGLKKGDVLLNDVHHAAMVQSDGGTTVEARGKSYGIVANVSYRNYPWNHVLRYRENTSATNISSGITNNSVSGITITVPAGLGKYYTYMNWNTVTNMDTEQGTLIKKAGKNYDSNGYGIVGNRYALAMTSTFGKIGDYVDVYMSNGRVIHGILADEKSQVYVDWDHNPANKWGHDNGQSIVEWVTNWGTHENPPSDGTVTKVINYGSYFDNPGYAAGATESYMYSENTYTDKSTETNKEPSVVWNNRVKENIHPKLQGLNNIVSSEELKLYANNMDITGLVGNLTWKNSIFELATTMSFDTPKSDAKYLSNLIITPSTGTIIRMCTDKEVFRGVILKVDDGDIKVNKYSAADLGWYLNKTTQTYQFKNITAGDAIKEMCDDLSINIVMMPELNENINQIYFDKTISAILTDILSKCDGDFNYDFTPEGLRIYKIGELMAKPEVSVASNIAIKNSLDYRGGVSHSVSIEEMKNSIKITSEKDSVFKELMVLQNRELIDEYGFLQKIVKIDPEKENAETVANAELNENARLRETLSFEIVEKYNSYTRAGEVIELDGIQYVIEGTDHSFKNGWHYNKMEVRKI